MKMDWFKHDVHCLDDNKLASLVYEYKAEGYAVFFHTLEVMYSNNGNPLDNLTIKRIALDLGITPCKAIEIMEYAASEECGFLFEKTDEGYISERVQNSVNKQNETAKILSEAGRKGGLKSANNRVAKGKPTLKPTLSLGQADKERELELEEDINIKQEDIDNYKTEDKKENKNNICQSDKSDMTVEISKIDYSGIIQSFNNKCKSLPKVKQITDKRRKAIAACWKVFHDDVFKAMEIAEMSDFLAGRNGVWTGCSFDWLFIVSNMTKVLEGNYKNKKKESYITGTDIRMDVTADGTNGNKYKNMPSMEELYQMNLRKRQQQQAEERGDY